MLKKLSFTFLMILLSFLISYNSFSDETETDKAEPESKEEVIEPKEEVIEHKKVLKISGESITSLTAHLSEEKFAVLEKHLLDKEFSQETLASINDLNEQGFSNEEILRIEESIELYFDVLENINKVAPLASSLNEIQQEITKMESTLESLLNEEKDEVIKKIEDLKVKLKVTQDRFKELAREADLDSINMDKLPKMLSDLGYKDSFHQVIYAQLSNYLSIAKKLKAASSIIKSLDKISADSKQLETELQAEQIEEKKAAISTQLKNLMAHKVMLEHDFTLGVTGIDANPDRGQSNEKINWEDELKKVFSPVIINLKEFTEPTRKVELLNTDITYYHLQLPKMKKGIEQIDMLLLEPKNKQLTKKLLLEKKYWEQQEKEMSTKLEVAKQQAMELESHKVTPGDAFKTLNETIFSKQGLNILLAIMAFFLSLTILYLLRRLFHVINPLNYIPRFKFIGSVIDVVLYILTYVISILTLMVALYMAGSMLALAIVAFIVVGMLWTLRNTLPGFMEQIQLLLGYGPVRHGEKIIYNGMQWLVESVGVYSYFCNPLLTGNKVRLPIKDLISMRSRPYDEGESWFPCKEGDYILINHKDWRQVIMQTPERVTFNWFEMKESMPTSTFLQQKVFNLSAAPFWAGVSFHIDYKHRFEIMDDIVTKLGDYLEEEFKKLPFGDKLIAPWVDFAEMTDLSLGMMVWVQLKPEAAAKYDVIKLRLTQICLRAANKYGWQVIRFNPVSHYQLDEINNNQQSLEQPMNDGSPVR